jgi:hypothetical protein
MYQQQEEQLSRSRNRILAFHFLTSAPQAPSSSNVDPSNYSTFFIVTSAIPLPSHCVILITFLGKAYAS